MTKSRTLRKAGAVALSLAMALSIAGTIPASAAAKKVKLSSTKGTITVGKTKKVTIKNTKKSNIKKVTFKYSNTKKRVTAKRSGLTLKFKGNKAGTVTITSKITLKKAVAKKKTYSLKYKATVKKATPSPTATPGELALDSVVSAVDIPSNGNTKYLVVKFNQKISSLDASQVEITRVSDGQLFAVEKVALASDGMSAQITLLGDQATATSTQFIKPLIEYNFKVTQNGKAAEKKFVVPVTYEKELITAVDVDKKTITTSGTGNLDAKDASAYTGDLFELLGVKANVKYDGSKVVSINPTDKTVAYGTVKVTDLDDTNKIATLTDSFDSTKVYKTSNLVTAGTPAYNCGTATYDKATKVNAVTPADAGTLAKNTVFVYAKLVGEGATIDRIYSFTGLAQAQLAEKVNDNYITGKLGAQKDVEKSYADYKFIKDNKLTTIASVSANEMVFADTTKKIAVVATNKEEGKVTDVFTNTVKVGAKEIKYADVPTNHVFIDSAAGAASTEENFKKLAAGNSSTIYYNVNGSIEFVVGDAGAAKTNTKTYILADTIKGYDLANEKYLQIKLMDGAETLDFTGTNGIKRSQLTKVVAGDGTEVTGADLTNGTTWDASAVNMKTAAVDLHTYEAGSAVDVTTNDKGAVVELKFYATANSNGRSAHIAASTDIKAGIAVGGFSTSTTTPVYEYSFTDNTMAKGIAKVTASTLETYAKKTKGTMGDGATYAVGDAGTKTAKFVVVSTLDIEDTASAVVSTKKAIILDKETKGSPLEMAWIKILEVGKEASETLSSFDQALATTQMFGTAKGNGAAIQTLVKGDIVELGIDKDGKIVVGESKRLTTAITVGAPASNGAEGSTKIKFNSGATTYVKNASTKVYKIDSTKPTGYDTSYDWDKAAQDINKITAATYSKFQGVDESVDVMIVEVSASADAASVNAAKSAIIAAFSAGTEVNENGSYSLPTATNGCTFTYSATVTGDVVTACTTAGACTVATMTGSLASSNVTLTISKGSATDTVTFTFVDGESLTSAVADKAIVTAA